MDGEFKSQVDNLTKQKTPNKTQQQFLVSFFLKFINFPNCFLVFIRMETILEQQRRYHEEKERLIDAMVKEMLHKKTTVKRLVST